MSYILVYKQLYIIKGFHNMRFIITTIVSLLLMQPVGAKSFTTMEVQLKAQIQQRAQALVKAEARMQSQKTKAYNYKTQKDSK